MQSGWILAVWQSARLFHRAALSAWMLIFTRSASHAPTFSRPAPLSLDCRKTEQEYEIDFVSLSYTRTMDDVVEARDFLDSVGLTATKIFAKLESRQVRC